MADLFERLYPDDSGTENIPVHIFFAVVIDYMAGETTRQQIINYWQLDAEAQSDLNALCNHIDGLTGVLNKLVFTEELHAVMMMAETGAKYVTKAAFRDRLGL